MRRFSLGFIIFCGLFIAPHFVLAAVVINEVAWMGSPPAVGETANQAANREWMEIANTGDTVIDLTGWILESRDGTPKITLSGSVAAGGFFLLERTGDDAVPGIAADQIYTGALGNGGEFIELRNTAGAVADLVDASAGWPAGDNSTKDTMQRSGSGWTTAAPTPRAPNAAASSESPAPAATSTPTTSPAASSGVAPKPSLGADAGPDATVIAGALVPFRGMVFGLDGEPLPSARFLWNFGDGLMQEGRSLNHVYYFPGTYQANLSVSSGEYTGSDWRIITVIPPELIISEAQPGDNGFVELFNASNQVIDLAGINFEDEVKNIFRIPAGTIVGSGGVIVFANIISGLNPSKTLILRDARSSILDKAEFSTALPFGASWGRAGEKFVAADTPTPGKFSPKSGGEKIVSSATSIPQVPAAILNPAAGYSVKTDKAIVGEPPVASEAPPAQNPSETENQRDRPKALASIIGANIFFMVSIILGLAAALAFFLLKRGI